MGVKFGSSAKAKGGTAVLAAAIAAVAMKSLRFIAREDN
jgi:hypothetical protein